MKNRFSSITVGTFTLEGLLNSVVNDVAVAVSLLAGNRGSVGLMGTPLFVDLY